MKKSVIWIGVLLALTAIYLLFQAVTGGGSDQDQTETAPERQKQARIWNGNGSKELNTTFNRPRASLTIQRFVFTKLNRKVSRAVVEISTPGSKRPDWFKNNSFIAIQYGSRKSYKPAVSSKTAGGVVLSRLLFNGVPTLALGPDCKREGFARDPLWLQVKGIPGQPIGLLVAADPPPPGHCLAEGVKAKPTVTISRVKVTRKKVFVYGRINNGSYKRVVIQVRGRVKSVARPAVRKGTFITQFKLPKGKYQVRAGVRGRWDSQERFQIR